MDKIEVAVVILNYNGVHYLEKFLPGVLRYSPSGSAYVVDNGSTDNSVAYLNKNFPEVKVITLFENYGFAGGYNEGLKEIEATYFLLLNSDVEVTKEWTKPLVSFLEGNKNAVAVQPKILNYGNKEYFDYAGAAGGFIDFLGYPFARGRIFGTVEKDLGQYNSNTEVFWTSGAAMLIRSKAFWEVGGFDASFFAHMEEIDLCWRLKNKGYSLHCIPSSVVYHVGGGTMDYNNPRKTYLNFRNSLKMLAKNLPAERLSKVLAWRFVLDAVAALQFILKGKVKHARAIYQGRKDFKKAKSSLVKKVEEKEEVPVTGTYTKSILASYFIKRRLSYSRMKDFASMNEEKK